MKRVIPFLLSIPLLVFVFFVVGCQSNKTEVVDTRVDFPDTYFPKPAVWMEVRNVTDSKIESNLQYRVSYESSDRTYWKATVECETKGLRSDKSFFGQCPVVNFFGSNRKSLQNREDTTLIIEAKDVSPSETSGLPEVRRHY